MTKKILQFLKNRPFLIVIIFISPILFYRLGSLYTMYHDEAITALLAFDIFKGNLLPVWEASGPNAWLTLYPYLATPFYFPFGPTDFAFHLPSIILGLLSIALLYWLVKELYDAKIAFLTSIIFATLTWFIAMARNDSHTILFLFLTLITFFFIVKGFKRDKDIYFYLAAFFLAINLMAWANAFFLLPFFFVILIWGLFKKKITIFVFSITILIFFLTLLPPVIYGFLNGFGTVSKSYPIWLFQQNKGAFLAHYQNKEIFDLLINQIKDEFSLIYKLFPVSVLLFSFLGLVTLFIKKKDKSDKLIIFLTIYLLVVFIFTIPAGRGRLEEPYLAAFILVPPILAAIFLSKITMKNKLIGVSFLILILINQFYFLNNHYFYGYLKKTGGWEVFGRKGDSFPGFRQAIKYVGEVAPANSSIVVPYDCYGVQYQVPWYTQKTVPIIYEPVKGQFLEYDPVKTIALTNAKHLFYILPGVNVQGKDGEDLQNFKKFNPQLEPIKQILFMDKWSLMIFRYDLKN